MASPIDPNSPKASFTQLLDEDFIIDTPPDSPLSRPEREGAPSPIDVPNILINGVLLDRNGKNIGTPASYSNLTPSLSECEESRIELSKEIQTHLIFDPYINKTAFALSFSANASDDAVKPGVASLAISALKKLTGPLLKHCELKGTSALLAFSCRDDQLESSLEKLTTILSAPLLTEEDLDDTKALLLQEQQIYRFDESAREKLVLQTRFNKDHPASGLSNLTTSTLEKICCEDVISWW
jgi:hypothetical protein